MELDDEEIIRLYNLFRNMQLLDLNASKYAGCDPEDDTMWKLQRKVKRQIEAKGPEWMIGKKIRKWW